MQTRDFYKTEVATAPIDASASEIAERMGRYSVGCVVIVEGEGRPVGIVTDRDLTCRVVARGADPEKTRAAEIMSRPLVTAGPHEPLEEVIERMRTAGVRRIPVVRDERLTGLVAVDDLVVELGRELDDLGEAGRRAVADARRRAQRERRREEIEESLAELRESVERAGRDAAEFVRREFDGLRERLRRGAERASGDAGKPGTPSAKPPGGPASPPRS
jgi:CBS domain-containing protein